MKTYTFLDTITIDDINYQVSYDYIPEELSHDHHAPDNVELLEVFDELGNEPDDKLLLEEIESRVRLLYA